MKAPEPLVAESPHGRGEVQPRAESHGRAEQLLEETFALIGPEQILGLVFNRESQKESRYGKYYYKAYTSPRE